MSRPGAPLRFVPAIQLVNSRQGSEGPLDEELGAELSAREAAHRQQARMLYQQRLELGLAREQARKDLPLSTYTEAYWKIDLHNLLHFLQLRMDTRAQGEIRQYARTIGHEMVRPLATRAGPSGSAVANGTNAGRNSCGWGSSARRRIGGEDPITAEPSPCRSCFCHCLIC